jgi:hypothetical protein
MPTILVGFSLGAATNPPAMWFRSVSLPSIAKGSFKYAKLVERIERYPATSYRTRSWRYVGYQIYNSIC